MDDIFYLVCLFFTSSMIFAQVIFGMFIYDTLTTEIYTAVTYHNKYVTYYTSTLSNTP